MTDRQMLKTLDLFSGIGGFSLGLERSGGFTTVAFCEINAFCRRVLKTHWPKVPIYEDIRALTAKRLCDDGIAIDAICGGFPCQDISTAGAGKGIEGNRSGLWCEYARIVGDVRPHYVIVENVAALLGRGMERVLRDLASLGYDAEWHCIPASAVGLPHVRDRLWIVAYPDNHSRRLEHHLHDGIKVAWKKATEFSYSSSQDFWVKHWASVPAICRRDDGVPDALDRGRSLGNAVTPIIPEIIGRAIISSMAVR